MVVAQERTEQGFTGNTTIKGPHRSGDGSTSIFRGLSRVPAFLRDAERYLTLKGRSQGISLLFMNRLCTNINEFVYDAGVKR